ncbi:SDR family NAD(P)-dependent oxidoreductase [Silicimonas algicola]|uniref:NADP-dependent 3-hydroxy acid dehydrogenase YdfG n=1 Tax=Silicimonas algicola TaxID=1826607 RepID=A0A316G689_9RHOB|nr:SDR family NAD(P)-dependent oxidoreductase [Silicimonas algicola]AZQ66797.1 SDR family NAD(P)-dependent oxidoreductase [Silicimonas algicola]PWK55300.1 NADP-dependent 3-hydroxy acid dehydrogenase YdfG [Silicimonas algicola]
MTHPALAEGNVATVTGGASGIGLASAVRFARLGMKVVVIDNRSDLLNDAAERLLEGGAPDVMTASTDVSDRAALEKLEREIADRFGGTDVLMNNAGIQPGSSIWSDDETWHRILDVNLWGIVNGSRAFGPRMIARGNPGAIVNTGSKQGITTPPGDPAYNVAKAGVKAFTEALQHDLRNGPGQVTAHLLIPGFVYTDLTRRDRTEKPAGAWTPDQTADFFLDRLNAGDFYILCPDNDVSRALDEKRMAWAMGDIIENRPPLSRWHPEYGDDFKAYVEKG